jgi:hypothetical protein
VKPTEWKPKILAGPEGAGLRGQPRWGWGGVLRAAIRRLKPAAIHRRPFQGLAGWRSDLRGRTRVAHTLPLMYASHPSKVPTASKRTPGCSFA